MRKKRLISDQASLPSQQFSSIILAVSAFRGPASPGTRAKSSPTHLFQTFGSPSVAVLVLPLGFLGPKESTLVDSVPLVEQAVLAPLVELAT